MTMGNVTVEHEALLQFLYMAPVGLIETSLDGDISMINPLSAKLLFPLQRSGLFSNLFAATERVAPELRNLAQAFAADSGTICSGLRFPVAAAQPGRGQATFLEISLIKLDRQRLMAVISDVSDIVERDRQLKHSDAWLNAIVVGVRDHAVVTLDRDGNVASWNQGVGNLTGLAADEILGRPFSIFFQQTAISMERASDYLHEADESGWSLHECWGLRSNGEAFWACNMIASVDAQHRSDSRQLKRRANEHGYLLIMRDMTDRRASTFELLRASMTDYLSGVLNRRAFYDAAEHEMARCRRHPRPLSLLAIDIDHFKQVNDQFGHATGDKVIKKVAGIIAQTAREIDIVARIGGEEFAVLLPSTDVLMAQELAERIRVNIDTQRLDLGGQEIHITASIGISTFDHADPTLDAMMKSADDAMYHAKQNGRNQWHTSVHHLDSMDQPSLFPPDDGAVDDGRC